MAVYGLHGIHDPTSDATARSVDQVAPSIRFPTGSRHRSLPGHTPRTEPISTQRTDERDTLQNSRQNTLPTQEPHIPNTKVVRHVNHPRNRGTPSIMCPSSEITLCMRH